MVEKFVGRFAALLSTYPDEIRVEKVDIDQGLCEIIIYANQTDAGKIIGKEGKMINALKTLISGCKAKDNISYKISVKPNR